MAMYLVMHVGKKKEIITKSAAIMAIVNVATGWQINLTNIVTLA
jgi:hypothetical protein